MPRPQETTRPRRAPSHDQIRQKTLEQFGFVPCLWQIRVVEAILKHDHDVVSTAATGSGKTLTFWMPLLFHEGGIQIVISPLNLLGKQNVDDLTTKYINAIAVTAKNADSRTFQVCSFSYISISH